MFMRDLITKKRLGQSLTNKEIVFIVNEYAANQIPDYQMSAFLMAVMFQSLTDDEVTFFTQAFVHSGQTIDLSPIPGIKIDKHSTGGIGDKVTLIVGPIMAALNVNFAKMSGPGLGFTGGTIDKLQSIPGYQVDLTIEQFIKQVQNIKISVISQTNNIVPADKKIYTLRDVTDTIDSIPLITISIMSKKIAMGADALLLDVKCGNGAFMKNLNQAVALAKSMVKIGKALKKNVKVEITNMDEPLGQAIGNKIEVIEAIKILSGQGDKELNTLIISSCTTMLRQAKPFLSILEATQLVQDVIKNGQALTKFKEWIAYQGGDINLLFSDQFWKPNFKVEIRSQSSGFLTITSALNFGLCAVKLGAGREIKTDVIDYDAGIFLHKKTGDKVQEGDILFTLYSSRFISPDHVSLINKSYQIDEKKQKRPIILKKIE